MDFNSLAWAGEGLILRHTSSPFCVIIMVIQETDLPLINGSPPDEAE